MAPTLVFYVDALYNYGMELFSSCVKLKAGVHVYGKKGYCPGQIF